MSGTKTPHFMLDTDSSLTKHTRLAGDHRQNRYAAETGNLDQNSQGWIGGLRNVNRQDPSMSASDYKHRISSLSQQLEAEAERRSHLEACSRRRSRCGMDALSRHDARRS